MTPDSWKQSTIAELCEMVKGSAPISKTKPGQFPLVTTGEERKTADYYQFDTAAVCVPMISSTGHGHASLKRVQYQEGKFALSNLLTALIVRDRDALSPRFLHLYLNYFKDSLIVPLMAGAANMSITVGRLATVPVRFPTLTEQERILRILDEADELRRLRAQADNSTADLIPAIFNEMFGYSANNHLWSDAPLSEVCFIKAGPFGSSLKKEFYTNKGYRIYGQEQVIAGNFNIGDYRISEDKFQALQAYAVQPGDILISLVGTIGKVVVVPEGIELGIINPRLLKLTPNRLVLEPVYLSLFIQLPSTQNALANISHGGTMGVLNTALLKTLRVPLPPIPLQKQFAAHVAEVNTLQESQKASRERLDELFQSLLHRAFTGEL